MYNTLKIQKKEPRQQMREKERKKNTKNCKIEEQARALTHFQQAYILHIHAKNTLYNDLLFLIRLILNEIK